MTEDQEREAEYWRRRDMRVIGGRAYSNSCLALLAELPDQDRRRAFRATLRPAPRVKA